MSKADMLSIELVGGWGRCRRGERERGAGAKRRIWVTLIGLDDREMAQKVFS